MSTESISSIRRQLFQLLLLLAILPMELPAFSLFGDKPVLDFPEELQWLNVKRPLTAADLKGKVVILDFWTYGCINCLTWPKNCGIWRRNSGIDWR